MPQTINVCAKCSDMCNIQYPNGNESDGYVPDGIGIGGGDYIELKIDVETGQIQGWNEDTQRRIQRLQTEK